MAGLRGLRTYLVGPIQFAAESSVRWRQELQEELAQIGIEVYIPPECEHNLSYVEERIKELWGQIRSGHRDIFNQDVGIIRKRDLKLVEKSDFLIAKFSHNNIKSVGSDQEIGHAVDFGIPCYLINPEALSGESFWLLNTIWDNGGEVFKFQSELIDYLKKKYKGYVHWQAKKGRNPHI